MNPRDLCLIVLLASAATPAEGVVGYKLDTDANSPGGAIWLAGPGSPAEGAAERDCAFFYDAPHEEISEGDLAQFLRIVKGMQAQCTVQKQGATITLSSVLQEGIRFVLSHGREDKCEWYVVTFGKPLAPGACRSLPAKK